MAVLVINRKSGEHMANLQRLEAIANSMLKAGEKSEAKVGGSYSNESGPGNYETVKGFMAATNHRLLVVLNAVSLSIRKDSFTYAQVTCVTMHDNCINVMMPDETITLCEVDDVCGDFEKFYKYVSDKKAPPPKTTITARDVEIPPPKK